MLRTILFALAVMAAPPALAQVSNCQAIAEAVPGAKVFRASAPVGGPRIASVRPASADYEVEITYVGHASFRIVAPDGTTIITDYSGTAGPGKTPDVATMNHAHITHWTPNPDPAITHVLPGWNPTGEGPIQHLLTVGEVLVRNVTTDIRNYAGVEPDGNSIFIFEIQGLCIGHVGHLHQELNDSQYAQIGRLDVVFVPIDGGYTMSQPAMMRLVERLRASIAIPMHWFSRYTLSSFLAQMSDDGLEVEVMSDPTIRVSLNSLPDRPTLMVLPRTLGF